MTWSYNFDSNKTLRAYYPVFESENGTESTSAANMNSFCKEIISAVEKNAAKDNLPKGSKYYIEILPSNNESALCVSINAKILLRGKKIFSFRNITMWKNGYIIESMDNNT